MTFEQILPWLALILGITSRVFLPFLLARRADPSLGWSWRLVLPQLLSGLIVLLILPLILPDLAAVAGLPPTAAYLAGWAAADVGRQADKYIAH